MKGLWLVTLLFWGVIIGAEPCFVAKEGPQVLRHQGAWGVQYSPCSTFKIAISLMGFDAEILIDEHNPLVPFKQGYVDWMESWRQPHDPTLWMKNSCVWYSQLITPQLGMVKLRDYIAKFNYGNQDLSGDPGKDNGLTNAWLGSSLKISAEEQAAFIQKLINSQVPVSAHAQEMTRRILFFEDLADGWKLYGKTGSGPVNLPDGTVKILGWFVGWVQRGERTIVFAYHNMYDPRSDVPAGKRAADELKKRLGSLLK